MNMHTQIAPGMSEVGAPDRVAHPAPELTIVIPTFKESHNVAQIVARLRGLLADYDWEVIFADERLSGRNRNAGALDRRA